MRPRGIIDPRKDISVWIIHVATDKPMSQLFWRREPRGEEHGKLEGRRNTDKVTVNRHLTRVDRKDETVAR